MSEDPLAKKIVSHFNVAKSERAVFETQWQEIKELVRCDTNDFNRQTVPGQRKYDVVYDGTAIDACEEASSGLQSYLTPSSERWAELAIAADSMGKGSNADGITMNLSDDPAALLWLEQVSDIIYQCYADPRSKFTPSMHEAYQDLLAFGTAVVNQEWDFTERHIIFNTRGLSEYYLRENSRGVVDTLWRLCEMTGEKIEEFFKEDGIEPTKLYTLINDSGGKGRERKYKILHHVCPRAKRLYGYKDKKNKKFASFWVSLDTVEILRESGFDGFPYCASRWVKTGGETYGRGPGMKCLPDIKVLQAMERVMLKAGQKAVDPALIVPDDGFMLPIKTSPGSINFAEAGTQDEIKTLEFKGNLQYGTEQSEAKRQQIRQSFHLDWFKRQQKDRESATGVTDGRDEMMRFLEPMLGRQQDELLGPTIARTYQLLASQMMFPPAPPSIQKKRLVVVYVSPAARAQQAVKADRMAKFMSDVVPMSQIAPTVMDAINTDVMLQQYAKVRGVSRTVIRSAQEIAQIRSQRAQQQQMQQAAQTAEPASRSILNLAQAGAAGGGSGGAPA